MTNSRFDELFGAPPRRPEERLTQREMNLAASIQAVTEEVVLRLARSVAQDAPSRNLCLAGGVALNWVANGKLLREGTFEDIWIQPAAGDAGGALGVALLIWHQLLDNPRSVGPRDSQRGSLLGPRYSADEIRAFLDRQGAVYRYHADEQQLVDEVAGLLASENVVGWLQGPMEFGPRAQILPVGFRGPSWVWGYLTDADVALGGVRKSYLGPAVLAERNITATPTYLNELPLTGSNVQQLLPVDMTVDWANPTNIVCGKDALGNYTNPACGILPSYTGPMPTAVHLHGGEVAPAYDGGPDAWVTPWLNPPTNTNRITGIGFPGDTYTYPNGQQESTVWSHDHALGITRPNVYAGMAGLYPIVDPANPPLATMPAFPQHDIPLIT